MSKLIRLKILNRNYRDLAELNLYITKELKENLENIKSKKFENQFNKLKIHGFRGGKYLLETIKKTLKDRKIILSAQKSRIKGNFLIINYKNYSKLAESKYFSYYRKIGLNTAAIFLIDELKLKDIPFEDLISKTDTELIIRNLPKLKELPHKTKDLLFFNVASMIKDPKILSKINAESLKEIQAASNQAFYKKKIRELKIRLSKSYPETKGRNCWQNWIYENVWLFGTHYTEAIPKKKVGFEQIPDFLFPTVDGFIDILEIKKPEFAIIKKDKNHPGSYYWDNGIVKAIGQVVNYLHEIEIHQLEIAKKLNLKTIKPRVIILAGRTNDWDDEKNEALRKLNSPLHEIKVLSYDHLIMRGKRLIQLYEKERE